jgi:hypothetical protein
MARPGSAWSAIDTITIAAAVLAMLAVTPSQWLGSLGAWTELIVTAQPLLGLIALALVGWQMVVARRRLASARSRRASDPELISSDELGVHRLLEVLQDIFKRMNRVAGAREHTARVVMLTGRFTVNHLCDIVKQHPHRSRWRIRILIMSPSAPVVGRLQEGTRQDIAANLGHLAELEKMVADQGWPYEIECRTYGVPPTMRGFLLDDRHLFLGHTAWDDGQLTTQGRHLVHIQRGTEASDLQIEWFASWFDWVFAQARPPADGPTGRPPGEG